MERRAAPSCDDRFVNRRIACPSHPIDTDQIVVTASRAPESRSADARERHRHRRASGSSGLGEPLVPALLRLVPSARGLDLWPARIADRSPHPRRRGQSHLAVHRRHLARTTRRPATCPRFELLNADLASRIEVVRGPQSALWGSEAIGGVIAVDGRRRRVAAMSASRGRRLVRLSPGRGIGFAATAEREALPAAVGWQRAHRDRQFRRHGDKDGYRNLSGRVRGNWKIRPAGRAWRRGVRDDCAERIRRLQSRTSLRAYRHTRQQPQSSWAGRLWAQFGERSRSPWSGRVGRFAARLDQPQFPRRRADLNRTLRDAADVRCAKSSTVSKPACPHRVDRARRTLNARSSMRATPLAASRDQDRIPQASGGHARVARGDKAGSRATLRCGATSSTDSRMRRRCGHLYSPESGEASPSPAPMPRALPSRPSSISTASFPGVSLEIRRLSLKARAGSKHRCAMRGDGSKQKSPAIVSGCTTKLSTMQTFTSTINAPAPAAARAWKPSLAGRLRTCGCQRTTPICTPLSLQSSGSGQVRELRRPKHSGSVAMDGTTGKLTYGASLAYSSATWMSGTCSRSMS